MTTDTSTIALIRAVTPILLGVIAAVVVLAVLDVDLGRLEAVVALAVGAAAKFGALKAEAGGSKIAGRLQGIPKRPTY